jgi:hypothetical protein
MQFKYQRKRDSSEKKPSENKSDDQSPAADKNLYKDVEKSKEEQERAKLQSL